MDTVLSLLDSMLQYTAPILIAAIGGFYSEKSGVVNIALDGFVIFGSFVASFIALSAFDGAPTFGQLVLCLLAATACGGLLSLIHAFISINLKADQVISGTAINLITPAIALFLVNHFNGTYELLLASGFPRYTILGNFTVYPTIIIAIILVCVTYYVIYKRPFGLRLRSVGEHPQAADTLGINVYHMRFAGVLISGFLAGIGGAIVAQSITLNFSATTIAGQGFIAMAAMIFGKWNSVSVMLSALLFGLAQSLGVIGNYIPVIKDIPSISPITISPRKYVPVVIIITLALYAVPSIVLNPTTLLSSIISSRTIACSISRFGVSSKILFISNWYSTLSDCILNARTAGPFAVFNILL